MALPMKHLLSLKNLQFFRPTQTVRNMTTRDLFLEKHFRMVEMLHYTILTYLFSNSDDNRVVLVIDTTQIQCYNTVYTKSHTPTSKFYILNTVQL